MLPGETILSGASPQCCGEVLEFEVLHSFAGYYIGTSCPYCGPYSRETEYFETFEEASKALASFLRTENLPKKRS
jgi:hypothetical protein